MRKLRWAFGNCVVAVEISVSDAMYVRPGSWVNVISANGDYRLRRVRMIDGPQRKVYVY